MIKELNSAIVNYRVISSILDSAQRMAIANNKYINKFKLPIIGKKTKNHKKEIDKYFDKLSDVVLEHAYLELFASFEAIIIKKIQLASGTMKSVLKLNYGGKYPFETYEDRFVKNEEEIGNLNRILELLKNKIPNHLYQELKTIVKYRDKLAHGKRFNKDIILNQIGETQEIMEDIINEL